MNVVRNRRGLSLIMSIFLLLVVGAMAIASVMVTQSASKALVEVNTAAINFYSASSGLEWIREVTKGYTTMDKDKYERLDGASYEIEASRGAHFTLKIDYIDDDNDPQTEDTITITSTGSMEDLAVANAIREVSITLTVPVSGNNRVFSDHFDQSGTTNFDQLYQFGQADSAHGGYIPYRTALSAPDGDILNLFTHSSEAGGSPSILRMGGQGENRLIINTQGCFKWSVSGLAGTCDYSECQSANGCEARNGLSLAPDGSGFQNYFIKIRARLISGDGFGIYFRASYANHNDPYNVDFGTLTAYIWQYDKGLGYLLPCDRQTAIAGNNGMGMLITRRVQGGSETCGADCSIFNGQADPSTYPFFCPENESNIPVLPGWRFREQDWPIAWRTIYIYVYQSQANVYVGREGILGDGGEALPEHVGEIDLSRIGAPLATGDIGLRTWNGSIADIDYINIYSNDDNNDPTNFPGD